MNATGRKLARFLAGLITIVATVTLAAPATAQFINTSSYGSGGGPPSAYFQFVFPAPPGAAVTIDFAACRQFWLAAVQPMPAGFPPLVVACIPHTVTTISGPGGFAAFRIVASSVNPNGSALPGSGLGCAVVRVAGAPVGLLSVTTMDQDNLVGVGVADLGAVISDVITCQTTPGLYLARTDYEDDGDDDAADIGRWVDVYLNVLLIPNVDGPSCGDPGFACCTPLL